MQEVAAFMHGLNRQEAKESLKNCGQYTCAIPAPLFAQYYSPTPGVQLNKSKIMACVNDDTLTLQSWPVHKVALRSGEDLDKGEFTCLTPEEIRIAMLANIARRCAEERPY